MVLAVLPAQSVPEMNTPHPPVVPRLAMNWDLVGLAVVGLIHASNVSVVAGAKAVFHGTVG